MIFGLEFFTNSQFDWSKCVDNCDSTNTTTIKGKYSTSMPREQTKQNQLF